MTLPEWLTRHEFRKSDQGMVALYLALVFVPLIGVMGFAIDFNRLQSAQTATGVALDAAALATAKDMAGAPQQSDAALKGYAENMFLAEMALLSPDVTCGQTQVQLSRAELSVDLTLDCRLPTMLVGILGLEEFNFSVNAVASSGQSRLELALMLDVSGSMAGPRLQALKEASQEAVDILIKPNSDIVRIALAPYSTSVNVGNFFRDATGEDPIGTPAPPAGSTTTITSTNTTSNGTRTTMTTSLSSSGSNINTQTCGGASSPAERLDCYNLLVQDILNNNLSPELNDAIDRDFRFILPTCATEREGMFRKTDRAPSLNAKISFLSNRCPDSPIMPLSSNAADLKSAIDDMSPEGSTAGHVGIEWAWYLIADPWKSFWPAPSKPSAYEDSSVKKVAILMTDGQFNIAYDLSQGDSSQQALETCENMKNAGIIIYSVAFQAPATAQGVLKACATSEQNFFSVSSPEALRQTYANIATELTDLRISK